MSKPNDLPRECYRVLITVGIKTLPGLLSHQGLDCPMQNVFVQHCKMYLSNIAKCICPTLQNVFVWIQESCLLKYQS